MSNNKKIVVGMSGGIDSSVAAYLLKNGGYEVIGVTLKHLADEDADLDDSKTCCSLDDIMDAKMACSMLEIPHYVIDAVNEFDESVVKYFLDEYSTGKTPSPCVVCDEKIKIKKLVEFADKIGADYVSTGHYCGVEILDELSSANLLRNAEDVKKDQTYMLYRLDENIIKRMVFPLENYKKTEIRELAKKIGLRTYDKKDSQGICFAPNGYIDFLTKKLDNIRAGDFVDKSGNIMGKHKGYQLYTIGQRRGLGLKLPRAYFIIEIRPKSNEIVLGDFDELFSDCIELEDYKFVPELTSLLNLELLAKPRFSSSGREGKLLLVDDKLMFKYNEKNAENAPGQHVVFYYKSCVVGGGIIKNMKR